MIKYSKKCHHWIFAARQQWVELALGLPGDSCSGFLKPKEINKRVTTEIEILSVENWENHFVLCNIEYQLITLIFFHYIQRIKTTGKKLFESKRVTTFRDKNGVLRHGASNLRPLLGQRWWPPRQVGRIRTVTFLRWKGHGWSCSKRPQFFFFFEFFVVSNMKHQWYFMFVVSKLSLLFGEFNCKKNQKSRILQPVSGRDNERQPPGRLTWNQPGWATKFDPFGFSHQTSTRHKPVIKLYEVEKHEAGSKVIQQHFFSNGVISKNLPFLPVEECSQATSGSGSLGCCVAVGRSGGEDFPQAKPLKTLEQHAGRSSEKQVFWGQRSHLKHLKINFTTCTYFYRWHVRVPPWKHGFWCLRMIDPLIEPTSRCCLR